MRRVDQHLGADEIELLAGEEGVPPGLEQEFQHARDHAASCEVCSQRIQVYRTKGTDLNQLRSSNRAGKGPECPTVDILLQVAGGLLPVAEQTRYLAHTAQCDHCGSILREIVKDFSDPPSEEEAASLSSLESSTEEWQQRLRSRIGSIPQKENLKESSQTHRLPRRFFNLSGWQYAAAALIISGVIGLSLYRMGVFRTNNNVDKLIAQAYGEKRTIQLRFSGAAYGPLRIERGEGPKRSHLPARLIEAEGIIVGALAKDPENVKLLQEHAQIFLLEGDADSALTTLEKALKIKPDEPSLFVDMATALVEKSEQGQSAPRYGEAIQRLNHALQIDSHDATALFNRAIVYEKISTWDKAIDDWQEYLRLDPKGAWADEARDHLKKLQDNLKEHERAIAEPLADPVFFAGTVKSGNQEAIARLDRRIEEYQDLALKEWLPSVFGKSRNIAKEPNDTLAALRALASLLSLRHHDEWLDDLLRNTGAPSFAYAITALGDAVSKSAAGDTEGNAQETAGDAAKYFSLAHNAAGELRAQVEQVHALRRAQQGGGCLSLSREIEARLRDIKYSWVQTQLGIDQCSCSMMVGRFDAARDYIASARAKAQISGYHSLQLRSAGISASIDTDEGNLDSAWQKNQEGLSEYWREGYSPPLRAQQFYDDMSYSAENFEDWDLALVLAQESVRMAALAKDPVVEALARQHVAGIALHSGEAVLAAQELDRSSALLNSLPLKNNARVYRLYGEMELAAIEMQTGKLHQAEERLRSIQPEVRGFGQSFTVSRSFYKTYGDLLAKEHRINESEQALLAGIDIVYSKQGGISKTSSRYSWGQENAGLYRSLIGLELEKGDRERALAVWEWYRAALLRRTAVPVQSLASFLASHGIRPPIANLTNQTVISYSLLPDGLAIWVFDNRGLRHRFQPLDSSNLSRQAAEFSEMCADQDSDLERLRAQAQGLFETLVAPVADLLSPDRTLVIELDELFGNLPFQALLTREKRYLSEIYHVVFSPGLFYDEYLRPAAPVSVRDHALIVGSTANVVDKDVSLTQLHKEVEEEASDIARKFPNNNLLKKPEATVQNMEAALPAAEIFHFVGHALATGKQEGLLVFDSSGQREAGTSLWGAQQATDRLFKRLKLAVLAACSTATVYKPRREVHGELVRTMLLAGVPHVVASRWNVDSKETVRFMGVFYETLSSGASVSSSLQAAESAQRARNAHPYFWAAFAAFGRA